MANILVFPLPEPGHIYPTLALTRYLTESGHRVTYLTAPQFEGQIRAVGGEIEPLIPRGAASEECSGQSVWYHFSGETGDFNRGSHIRSLVASIIERSQIDLLLCDRVIAFAYRSNLTTIIGKDRVLVFSTSLLGWGEEEAGDPDLTTIVFCPEPFELPKFKTPRQGFVYVEPSLRPLDLEPTYDPIFTGDRPLVLAAFGSQSIRYRDLDDCIQLIQCLAQSLPHLNFLVAIGAYGALKPSASILPLANLAVTRKIPQRRVLNEASALITHGGLGSIKEAICAGVPLVVLPMLHDQPFNAMRVRQHGLGEALFPGRRSLDEIGRAVDCAIAGAYDSQISKMQAVFLEIEKAKPSRLIADTRLAALEG